MLPHHQKKNKLTMHRLNNCLWYLASCLLPPGPVCLFEHLYLFHVDEDNLSNILSSVDRIKGRGKYAFGKKNICICVDMALNSSGHNCTQSSHQKITNCGQINYSQLPNSS